MKLKPDAQDIFAGVMFIAFAALIHARTEGSPLFMVDVIRYLRDRRVIVQNDDEWSLAQAVPDIELPASIRSMIQRKSDQLGEADRRLLITASVQGYEFEAAVVAKARAGLLRHLHERPDGGGSPQALHARYA